MDCVKNNINLKLNPNYLKDENIDLVFDLNNSTNIMP